MNEFGNPEIGTIQNDGIGGDASPMSIPAAVPILAFAVAVWDAAVAVNYGAVLNAVFAAFAVTEVAQA